MTTKSVQLIQDQIDNLKAQESKANREIRDLQIKSEVIQVHRLDLEIMLDKIKEQEGKAAEGEGWIRVDVSLPNPKQKVEIKTVESGFPRIAFFHPDFSIAPFRDRDQKAIKDTITHWRALKP